ncbi:sugar phosphate isomerase/epimerase family protein [Humibacter ginsenosidimutans]|uniref:TIM barrel protein n=1 Tax=Humibacter ginsenosidimutans TaxID=2599293 RepID=A0A5B8M713_9MICO|nr:sugar phosphate isomerase/epimerase [Humibacter ginsenosidimutans]QDZ16176.1 TIM barrel protein [Humibacter ginsenosidimutans]
MIPVAGAPVSFGVFELRPEEGVELAGPDTVCQVLQDTGYVGVDMGPVGFLGRGAELRERLARHGLELAGGWIDLPYADQRAFDERFAELDGILDVFVEAAEASPQRLPLPTLACSGSAVRQANPGGGPEFALTDEQWKPYADNVMRAVEHVRARGLEPTFHHHACTYVETPDEIDELLSRTDVGLTFDTGHLLLGGGDPLTGWRRWRQRINHLHLKDAKVAVLDEVVKGKGDMRAVWAGRAFVPFGEGDLDLDGIMNEVIADDFDGWLIVEQDTIPQLGDDPDQIARDHHTNREALKKWL